MVAIELQRKSGVPLYIQLKEQIRQQVTNGAWGPGFKLPTERQLSGLLGISRNTVGQAFNELEVEGIVHSFQGKGTFIVEADPISINEGRIHRLENILEEAIEQALLEGFTCSEYLATAGVIAQRKQQLFSTVRIVFIECNREQVDFFSKQLELGSGVSIFPIVIDELYSGAEEMFEKINEADIIVTTFFHIDEVRRTVPDTKRVLAVALDPQLETIVRIARIPRGKRLGLICISSIFAEKVMVSLTTAGIDYLDLVATHSREPLELTQIIGTSDVLLVSPGRKKEVAQLCLGNKEIIEFVYKPDQSSINLLQSEINKLRERGV
ncbi:MAG: GntR family transcriptional regulator [bacterium]|nr:GntR family transcriptional regulator [bacterium]